jgi:hypothetical protein
VSDDLPAEQADEHIPWPQMLFDDIFLLLFVGLVVPTLFYIIWNLIELASVRPFVP